MRIFLAICLTMPTLLFGQDVIETSLGAHVEVQVPRVTRERDPITGSWTYITNIVTEIQAPRVENWVSNVDAVQVLSNRVVLLSGRSVRIARVRRHMEWLTGDPALAGSWQVSTNVTMPRVEVAKVMMSFLDYRWSRFEKKTSSTEDGTGTRPNFFRYPSTNKVVNMLVKYNQKFGS